MRLCHAAGLALAVAQTGPVAALDLDLPGRAELTREVDRDADTYFLPEAPFAQGRVPAREIEGRIVRQAWRIEAQDLSTLSLLGAIRAQMQAQGYDLLLDCTADECGGFDFRFGVDVLPAPDMFVDLFDFRFLSAENAARPGEEFVSVLVSRAGQVGYVQLVLAGGQAAVVAVQPDPEPEPEPEPVVTAEPVAEPEPTSQPQTDPVLPDTGESIADGLLTHGHAILPDLVFATGASTLEQGTYASLTDLAAFLNADAGRRVVLVGHTDAVGALEGNVRLSRARAASVMQRLMQDHGVAEKQLDAQGMGFLAPVASNATPEGRRANRRVEAVLLNTE